MSQFRSEEMKLLQIFMARDSAHETLKELGFLGCVQFKDLNHDKNSFNRPHVLEVRKCDDMMRILRYLADVCSNEKIVGNRHMSTVPAPPSGLDEWQDRLQEIENEVKVLVTSARDLEAQKVELEEHKSVLKEAARWLGQQSKSFVVSGAHGSDNGLSSSNLEMKSLTSHDFLESGEVQTKPKGMLGYVAGCIPTENIKDFNRTLFRKTRGNMLLLHQEMESNIPVKKNKPPPPTKSIFIVFFSGDRSRTEIDKIANSYGAKKYGVPDSRPQQEEALKQLDERLSDLQIVIERTTDFRKAKLEQVQVWLEAWTEHAMREKAIYHSLNKFNVDSSSQCYIAEAWCPVNDYEEVLGAIRRGDRTSGVPSVVNQLRAKESPPTFFRSTPLTSGTQAIIDAYGMADYQEFNPAVFSVITFPFLFGVMFGDIGHGFIMTLAAGLLCLHEGRLSSLASHEMFGTVYQGRYAILLMGIFATYSGFIYNELFSVPLELFGRTAWCSPDTLDSPGCDLPGTSENAGQKWLRSSIDQAWDFDKGESNNKEVAWSVYPLGTDPGFSHTPNKLNSVNSFKMKFAIIMGVTQMVAGIFCKLMNTIYFKDWITLRVVFIPEILFINCIFGYLCCLIMIKWTTNWDATYVLNNNGIVSIPQVYCLPDLSNLPCWTPPYHLERDTIPGYGPRLAELPEHQWCMLDGVATAGCAVMEMASGRLLVESNVFGSKELIDPLQYNTTLCDQDPTKCILFKQVPPSLLDSLIKMFMNIGTVPAYDQLVSGQGGLQSNLILVAVLSVPVMLVAKPYLMKWKHQKLDAQKAERAAVRARASSGHTPMKDEDEHEEEEGHGGGHGGHGHGEFDFGEEMVHQMIHTIEFVLACISNTASYLRLWALSLAHAQLSEVFWEKAVVEIGVESASPVMLFVTSSAWACFTVGVLMGMESLSAFLHALRLHWVEYMGKFYSGTGVKFQPFSFADMAAASAVTQDSDD